jgi:hypothetical protein
MGATGNKTVAGSEMNIEQIMQLVTQEVARRKASDTQEKNDKGDHVLTAQVYPVRLPKPQEKPRIEDKKKYLLSEFLRYHDEEFLQNAVTIQP